MMPSLKDLIINKRSAQNGIHNGMTPKDAGHVILNLIHLWEPCTELTFESLESQAKQDLSAPYRVRNRRACTCKSSFTILLLMGLLVSVFAPYNTGPEVATLSLGDEHRSGLLFFPCRADASGLYSPFLLQWLRESAPHAPLSIRSCI